MIKLGSKKLGYPGWRNQEFLSDETLINIYGKEALQYFSQNNSTPFVFTLIGALSGTVQSAVNSNVVAILPKLDWFWGEIDVILGASTQSWLPSSCFAASLIPLSGTVNFPAGQAVHSTSVEVSDETERRQYGSTYL